MMKKSGDAVDYQLKRGLWELLRAGCALIFLSPVLWIPLLAFVVLFLL